MTEGSTERRVHCWGYNLVGAKQASQLQGSLWEILYTNQGSPSSAKRRWRRQAIRLGRSVRYGWVPYLEKQWQESFMYAAVQSGKITRCRQFWQSIQSSQVLLCTVQIEYTDWRLVFFISSWQQAVFFISVILGSAQSDLYWSVGVTFIQIIDESAFIHPNVCTFIQSRAIRSWIL